MWWTTRSAPGTVSRSPLTGKTEEEEEFTVAEGPIRVCLLHFRLEDLRQCEIDRIYAFSSKSSRSFECGYLSANRFPAK